MAETETKTLEEEVLKEEAKKLMAECYEVLGGNPNFTKTLIESYWKRTDLTRIAIEFVTNGTKYGVVYKALSPDGEKIRVMRYKESDDLPVEQLIISNRSQDDKVVHTLATGDESITRVDNQKAIDKAGEFIASLKPAESNNPEKA